MREQFILSEKYRPQTVGDCILPERLKKPFLGYVSEKQVPNLLLTGRSGVGKTTIARAMCEELGCSYLLINASEERGIDILRTKVKTYASTHSLLGGKKVIIMDEADNLTHDAQDAFRGIIEEFSTNCSFIFTGNHKERMTDAIKSRCVNVDFTLKSNERVDMIIEFYKRLRTILKLEHIAYEPDVLQHIVERYFPDYRRTLNEIQHLSKMGPLDVTTLSFLTEVSSVKDVFKFLKDKEFGELRRWLVKNRDSESATIFRALYDGLDAYVAKISIPSAIIILAKYQYQDAFVTDKEINLLACLTEIMLECDFT